MTVVAAICVDKFGRKPLLLLSGLGTCLSLFTLGVFFFLDENKKDISDVEIQPPLIFNQSKILNKFNWGRKFQKCEVAWLNPYFSAINETLVDEKYRPDSNIDPQILQNISWLPLVSYLKIYICVWLFPHFKLFWASIIHKVSKMNL